MNAGPNALNPATNRFSISIPSMVSLAAALLVATIVLGPFGDLDYTWQILAGQQILATGQFQITDTASYTIHGQTLPDFEWLWEVTLYLVWKWSGYTGLKLLKLACAFVPMLIVGHQLKSRGCRWPRILFVQLIAVVVLAPNWNLRPLYCTTIGLLLVSGALHDHCTGRRRLPLWLPLVTLIWANCHPGVITGQALLFGAIVWEWCNQKLRFNQPLTKEAMNRLIVVGSWAIVTTFISPDPVGRLAYTFNTRLDDPIWRVFVEMQPSYWFITKPPYTMILAYVVAITAAITIIRHPRQMRTWEITLIGAACGLAQMATRSLPDFLLVTLVFVSTYSVFPNKLLLTLRDKWIELAESPALRWQWSYPITALCAVLIICMAPSTRSLQRIDIANNPVAAVDWMAANGIHGRVFAPADYGSYLGWRLGNQTQCYVDTRGFFFPPQMVADSQLLPMLEGDWQRRLDRVLRAGTDYFLLETTGPRSIMWQAIQPHMQPMYQDGQAVLVPTTHLVAGIDKYVKAISKPLVAPVASKARQLTCDFHQAWRCECIRGLTPRRQLSNTEYFLVSALEGEKRDLMSDGPATVTPGSHSRTFLLTWSLFTGKSR